MDSNPKTQQERTELVKGGKPITLCVMVEKGVCNKAMLPGSDEYVAIHSIAALRPNVADYGLCPDCQQYIAGLTNHK
jgi:hypothetical protein